MQLRLTRTAIVCWNSSALLNPTTPTWDEACASSQKALTTGVCWACYKLEETNSGALRRAAIRGEHSRRGRHSDQSGAVVGDAQGTRLPGPACPQRRPGAPSRQKQPTRL